MYLKDCNQILSELWINWSTRVCTAAHQTKLQLYLQNCVIPETELNPYQVQSLSFQKHLVYIQRDRHLLRNTGF